jgi:hypothetical protein
MSRFARWQDLILPVGIISSVLVILVPLPQALLDVRLAANITASVIFLLTTIYRLFFKVGTTHWILGRAVRLWSAHYDSGYLEVLTRGPKTAVLRIRGFATPHKAHCLSVQGWAERSIELSGGERVTTEEPLCRTRGDELCQLEAKWE